jgi:hypothetical protein
VLDLTNRRGRYHASQQHFNAVLLIARNYRHREVAQIHHNIVNSFAKRRHGAECSGDSDVLWQKAFSAFGLVGVLARLALLSVQMAAFGEWE